jgi:hypothetical protein
MRIFVIPCFLAACVICFSLGPMGCVPQSNPVMLRSVGSPGELLVVVDVPERLQKALDIDEWFGRDFPALPQSEPQFRISRIPFALFDGHWRKARHIFVFRYQSDMVKSQLITKENQWALNQTVTEVVFADTLELTQFMKGEMPHIYKRLYNADIAEMIKSRKAPLHEPLKELVAQAHGISIDVPQGFRLKKDTVGFTWLEFDTQKATMGILIYSNTGDSILVNDDYAYWREQYLSCHIPGDRDNSYMITEHALPMVCNGVLIHGQLYSEYRGLWKMKNDFMGGPFVGLVHQKPGRLVVVEAFIYAPGHHQKSVLVRSVDAVLRTSRLL